ncbi:aldo/keto reductase [Streptomyces sp. NPDC054775]
MQVARTCSTPQPHHDVSRNADKQQRSLGKQGLSASSLGYEKNLEAVRALGERAATKNATVAQLALAWLLASGHEVVPIRGTRSVGRLEENVGAAVLALSETDLARIAEILPFGGFGARYLPSMLLSC